MDTLKGIAMTNQTMYDYHVKRANKAAHGLRASRRCDAVFKYFETTSHPNVRLTLDKWFISQPCDHYQATDLIHQMSSTCADIDDIQLINSKETNMDNKESTPIAHKHAEIITEWVKDTSREIEFSHNNINWYDCSLIPPWSKDMYYRFKDSTPKTEPVTMWLYLMKNKFDNKFFPTSIYFISEKEVKEEYDIDLYEVICKIDCSEITIDLPSE